jgi:diphosphomevalonate decarboxylase
VSTTAEAHPNIALVKYWGKHDVDRNIPAAPSLSITLDTLKTTTQVTATTGADKVYLDNKESHDKKILDYLKLLRRSHDIGHLEIHTQNNFPTAAGLASSASGFAALITAINSECELGLRPGALSALARRASGSAARSIFGGFVALTAPDWEARALLEPDRWPLRTVVAITTASRKGISSSAGMELSKSTSPYYPAWVASTHTDFEHGEALVSRQDFTGLATLAEFSCLKMHGLMLSTNPGLLYWNAATMACIHAVRELRGEGLPVFFTVDAGPQVKAICLPEAEVDVSRALSAIDGVQRVLRAGLGAGVRIVAP